MIFTHKIIPEVAKQLKLGVFNRVAVREELWALDEVKFYNRQQEDNGYIEIITFYNKKRNDKSNFIESLHIYFRGTLDDLDVCAYATSENRSVHQGTRISDLKNPTKIGEITTNFKDIAAVLEQFILDAQVVLNIELNKKIHHHFDATTQLLIDTYSDETNDLEYMTVHFAAHSLSVAIICETGWGDDFYFTVGKGYKRAVMKIDLDARFIEDRSTYRETLEIKDKNFISAYKEFFYNCNFIRRVG